MIEPAELVLAYSSRMTGASSSSGNRPSTPLAINWFIFKLAWCSQKRRTADGSSSSAVKWLLMCAATIGHTSLKTCCPR